MPSRFYASKRQLSAQADSVLGARCSVFVRSAYAQTGLGKRPSRSVNSYGPHIGELEPGIRYVLEADL